METTTTTTAGATLAATMQGLRDAVAAIDGAEHLGTPPAETMRRAVAAWDAFADLATKYVTDARLADDPDVSDSEHDLGLEARAEAIDVLEQLTTDCDECGDAAIAATTHGLCSECADDLVCRDEDCDERNDNGEGFDGYCGNCADRAEREGSWEDGDRECAECGDEVATLSSRDRCDGCELGS